MAMHRIAILIVAATLAAPVPALAASAIPKGKGGAGGGGELDDITRRIERELDRITSGLERDRQAFERTLKAVPARVPATGLPPVQNPQ